MSPSAVVEVYPAETTSAVASAMTAATAVGHAAAWCGLSVRSAIAPAQAPNNSSGVNCMATMTPKPTEEGSWRSTIQATAVFCVHVPMTESTWPVKNSR